MKAKVVIEFEMRPESELPEWIKGCSSFDKIFWLLTYGSEGCKEAFSIPTESFTLISVEDVSE